MPRDRDLRGSRWQSSSTTSDSRGSCSSRGLPSQADVAQARSSRLPWAITIVPSWSTTSSSQAPVSWEGFEHQVAWPQLEQDDDLRGQGLQLADHGCAETSWVPIHHAQAGEGESVRVDQWKAGIEPDQRVVHVQRIVGKPRMQKGISSMIRGAFCRTVWLQKHPIPRDLLGVEATAGYAVAPILIGQADQPPKLFGERTQAVPLRRSNIVSGSRSRISRFRRSPQSQLLQGFGRSNRPCPPVGTIWEITSPFGR